MKKQIFTVMMVLVLSLLASQVNAQTNPKQKKTIKSSAQNYIKSRGPDENIKTGRPTEDTHVARPEKTRGEVCQIFLCNNSGFAIDIFVSGKWEITIPAYSCYNTVAYQGKVQIYGKSVGGTKYWGPSEIDCENEYSWELSE